MSRSLYFAEPSVRPTPASQPSLVTARAALGVALACCMAPGWSQTGPQACGNPFQNHFGPFDYRKAPAETRKLVEDHHFTPGIESMTKPVNTMMNEIAGDVSYTLNVFPNHPRALLTMERLAGRWKSDPPPGTRTTVECWFDRAIRFQPNDTVVRALYAQFLGKAKRLDEAERQLKTAAEHAGDNPISHYNIGLVAMDLRLHALALQQAHRAQEMGYERAELPEQLKKAGKWVDRSQRASN